MAHQTQVNPERLRVLGKQASLKHVQEGVPLTEAVVQVLQCEPGINSNHVKRVTEFSNNDAFQMLFEKEAGSHRIINFDGGPADPADVLKELNMSATPSQVPVSSQVANIRSFIPGQDSAEYERFFDTEKTASAASYQCANPNGEIVALRSRLNGIRQQFISKLGSVGVSFEDGVNELYEQSKQLVLGGESPSLIATAITKVASSSDAARLALQQIHLRMESDNLPYVGKAKVASGLLNTGHPLVKAYMDFEKVAYERYNLLAAVDIVDNELRRVNSALARGLDDDR